MPRGPVQSELVEHAACRHCRARWTGPPGTVIQKVQEHFRAEHYRAPEKPPEHEDPYCFKLEARKAIVLAGFRLLSENSAGLLRYSHLDRREELHLRTSRWAAFNHKGTQVSTGTQLGELQRFLAG